MKNNKTPPSPSQSKMKVLTDSMSSSGFLRGCADARVVKLAILDLSHLLVVLLLLVFHLMLTKSDKGFGEVDESFLRPKNVEALGLKWQRNRDGFVEERAETEREAVAVVLLSIFYLEVVV
jgi:hypothetical protein